MRRIFREIKVKEVIEKTPPISPVTQRSSLPDKIELSDLLPDESGERHYVGELPDESGECHYKTELPDEGRVL